jgi:hypothetical protein
LITNSNFEPCSTGKSAGLAPLRILSTCPCDASDDVDHVGAIGYEPTGLDKLSRPPDRRDARLATRSTMRPGPLKDTSYLRAPALDCWAFLARTEECRTCRDSLRSAGQSTRPRMPEDTRERECRAHGGFRRSRAPGRRSVVKDSPAAPQGCGILSTATSASEHSPVHLGPAWHSSPSP